MEPYFRQNYDPLTRSGPASPAAAQLHPRRGGGFFLRSLEDDERRCFLIEAPDGRIIGEMSNNEIGLGRPKRQLASPIPPGPEPQIGPWAVRTTRDYAFGELELHRLSLDVCLQPRAEKLSPFAPAPPGGGPSGRRLDGTYAG